MTEFLALFSRSLRIGGKILVLVSKHETARKNLVLVSNPKIRWKNSRACLKARD